MTRHDHALSVTQKHLTNKRLREMTECANCHKRIKKIYGFWRHLNNQRLCYPFGYRIFPDDKAKPKEAEGK
jgi:hypothetical protein